MASEDKTPEIALLLDWENIRFGLLQRNLIPNISAIREEAQSLGRVVIARAYADFQNSTMYSDPRRLYAAGIEPVYVPGRTYQSGPDSHGSSVVRKNSVDVKLTADCVEFCHRYPNISSYMLVSGDGDFIHLVNTMRPYGKFVAIVALSWTASPRLTESADLVRYYDLDVEPLPQSMPKSVSADSSSLTADGIEDTNTPVSSELAPIYEGIKEIVESHGKPMVMAAIKPTLSQRIGEFQERNFGHSKFKPLVLQAQAAGYVRVVTEGLVDWVMPVNADFDRVDEDDDTQDMEFDSGHHAIGFGYGQGREDSSQTFDTLPESLRYDIIRFSNSLELRSRYITFRYLSQNLGQQPWMQLDFGYLWRALDSAVEMGLFTRDTYEDFDEYTGLIRRLPTLKLNSDHQQVIEALESASETLQGAYSRY